MKRRVIACAVGALFLLAATLSGCGSSAEKFTEEEHLARIEERARERFLGEDSEYTDLEVFPIYDENDEFRYALIELQPTGFMYVYIDYWRDAFTLWVTGWTMYSMSAFEPTTWVPYRVKEGEIGGWEDEWGQHWKYDAELFYDENGEPIQCSQSHFAVAGITDERRYFLATPQEEYAEDQEHKSYNTIPAVKRGEQYLNLIDGALIDYKPDVYDPTYATETFGFNLSL